MKSVHHKTKKREPKTTKAAEDTIPDAAVLFHAQNSQAYLDSVEEEVDRLFGALVTLVGCASPFNDTAKAAHKAGLAAFAASRQNGVWFREHLSRRPKLPPILKAKAKVA